MSLTHIPMAVSFETIPGSKNVKPPTKSEKFKFIIDNVTVEPLIFFYVVTVAMNSLTTQNLYLEKACRVNLKFERSVCDAIFKRNSSGYDEFQEIEVQKLVSEWSAYRSVFVGTIPVLVMIFLGSWSDRHNRRKPIIILPIIGDTLGTCGLFVCSYFFTELPLEFSWVFDTFSYSLFGGWGCSFIGIYSYISSEKNKENRTFKIGIASICYSVGMSVGVFLSGVVINRLGFQGAYIISFILQMIAILFTHFMINDENHEENDGKNGFFNDFFAIKHIKNTFAICFKKDELRKERRKKIIVIMIIGMLSIGPLQGEQTVLYMYIRLKCGWNEVDFSIFNSSAFFIQLVGKFLALYYLLGYLKIGDASLGILSILGKIFACLIYAFAPTGLFFYVGSLIEIFFGTCYIAMRSILGKTVPQNELGQTNSIFGICESVMPSLFGPLYTTIYIHTVKLFPGFFYLVAIIFYALCLALFIWLRTDDGKAEEKHILQEQGMELIEKTKK